MTGPQRNGTGSVAAAPRAQNVASSKPTLSDDPNAEDRVAGRPSLRAAINAMCKSCIYDPGSGNGAWREQVAGCCSSNCPLHSVRPLPVRATKPGVEAQSDRLQVMGVAARALALFGPKMGRNDQAPIGSRAA
jgi:hypothetical protein